MAMGAIGQPSARSHLAQTLVRARVAPQAEPWIRNPAGMAPVLNLLRDSGLAREVNGFWTLTPAAQEAVCRRAHRKGQLKAGLKFAEKGLTKARGRDSVQAAGKLTEVKDGTRRIVDQPPLIMHFDELDEAEASYHLFGQYRATLEAARRELLDRYEIVDLARKVVGVGSVGTR